MYDENLGNSVSFMVDAILTTEQEYRDIETAFMDAALHIVQRAWNAEVRGEAVIAPCNPVISPDPEIQVDDAKWEQLIRDTDQELVNILRMRKEMFFPDDTRLIHRCFCNRLGTISVEEENEEGTLHVGES